jgi:hypothetical protein
VFEQLRAQHGVLEWEDRAMRLVLSLLVGFSVAGCGGLVVLELDDGPASDGGSGGSGIPGEPMGGFGQPTDAATTGTSSDQCAALLEAFETANDHARACSPLDPNIQCDGSVVLLDACGCPSVVANENLVAEIADAQAAYEAWVAAGCGPYECATCMPATNGGFCETMGEPSKGRCTPNPP